jgi:hypothetical protein
MTDEEDYCGCKYCMPLDGDSEYHKCSHPDGGPCGGWCVPTSECDFVEE